MEIYVLLKSKVVVKLKLLVQINKLKNPVQKMPMELIVFG